MISVTIMAHPDRASWAIQLSRRLHARVIWDRENDRWETGRRALLAHLPYNSKRSLVIQDDAMKPPGFLPALHRALDRVPPNSPLVLYCTNAVRWKPIFESIPPGTSFLTMKRIHWGVGIVIPSSDIEVLVEYGDGLSTPNYDHRLGSYYEEKKTPVYYTWPNLLDHRNLPSLIPGRTSRRRAANFAGSSTPRLTWKGNVVAVEPPDNLK